LTVLSVKQQESGFLQELFKPLLGALGLESVQMSAVMKELGGAVSLRGGLSSLRINIVDSEFGSSGMTAAGWRSDAARGKVSEILLLAVL